MGEVKPPKLPRAVSSSNSGAKAPLKIRVHDLVKPGHGWHEDDGVCPNCEAIGTAPTYILISEHEKEINKWRVAHEFLQKNIKRRLAEKDKEIENLKGADQINKTMARESVEEKDDLRKVIDHWKQSYNQAADERNEAKEMLVAMAKRLPLPPNVTITHAFAKKLLDEKKPKLIAKKRKSSLMKRIW